MGGIASCVSNVMYLSEKLTLYLTCTGLICCLVLTISATLGMGVGLGYNYCFVDMKTKVNYIKGHYTYPGSRRWPYTRQGNVAKEPALDEIAEDEDLRRSPQEPDILTSKPDEIDPTVLVENLRNNNTCNGTTIDYHPTLPHAELFNGTESSVITTVDAPTNYEITEITENSPETNSSSNTTSGTTEDETENKDETDKPTTKPSIVNEEQLKSSPSYRKVKKLVVPITGLDLISLLSKIKAENRNYSLQIVTT